MRRIALILAVSAVSLSAQAATINANFADGNGTGTDGYLGSAGNGWTTAWATMTGGTSPSLSNSVVNTSPLNGGSNYLSFNVTTSGASGTSASSSMNRRWDNAVVPVSVPYRVSFDFRPDEQIHNNNPADASNAYNIWGTSQVSAATDTNETWAIRGIYSSANGEYWGYVGDGNNTGNPTGVAIVAGTIYHFVLDVDQTTKTYSFTMSYGSNTYTSPPGITFRNQSTAGLPVVEFGAVVDADHENPGSSSTLSFSLDSISIAPVPEPAVMTAVATLGMAALLRRRAGKDRPAERH